MSRIVGDPSIDESRVIRGLSTAQDAQYGDVAPGAFLTPAGDGFVCRTIHNTGSSTLVCGNDCSVGLLCGRRLAQAMIPNVLYRRLSK